MLVTKHPSRENWPWAALKERVVAGFGDFRFTRRGFFKWSSTALGAIVLGAVITLYFLDWNQMRGPLGRYLSHRTGREVRIDGNLRVDLFTLQPSVDASGIFLGNPGWVGASQAARIDRLRVDFRLLPLFLGNLVLVSVQIVRPNVLVVRDRGGRTNWDSANPGPAMPPIRRFLLEDGHLRIDDAVRQLHFIGTISSQETSTPGRAAFNLTGQGNLNQSKFTANITGGPLLNVDASTPYNFTADVRAGTTHVTVKGAITQPFHLDRYAATMNISGPTLSDLYFLSGLVLPNTPAYHLTMVMVRDGPSYRLNDIDAIVGSTDLHGDLSIDMSGNIPALAGKVASRVLVLQDLGPLVGGGASEPANTNYLLPQTLLHTERLTRTNAEVDYTAAKVRSQDIPLTTLDTHISVEDGVLKLKPLAFGFTRGKLAGSIRIDARRPVPISTVDAQISGVHAENFIKRGDKPIYGVLEARAVLTGIGKSVHDAASNATGIVTAVVPSGGMRRSLAEWSGVDVLTALSLNLAGDNSNTNLRCAVASFGAKDGVLTTQQFVIDTDPVRVDGTGTINLRDETLDMQLQGKPKHLQLMRLRAPITVKGTLAHPVLGIGAGQALTQGGIAAALGLVNPLAAILAFVDPGLAKDANCGSLVADAKAKGAQTEMRQAHVRK
jgi:AsmA family protein